LAGLIIGLVVVTAGIVVTLDSPVQDSALREGTEVTVDSGRIVYFASADEGAGSYMVADPRSRTSVPLTDVGAEVDRGALEPDGRSALVACVPDGLETSADLAENLGICRLDLASGLRTLVVDAGYPVQHPTPSPDGESIVFASGAEADHGLKLTSTGGGEVHSLCNGFCPLYRFFDIAWSPDGTKVAFVGSTPGSGGHLPQIYVVTVGESDYTRLTNTRGMESAPDWSPDGTKLAFSSSRTGDTELWVMNADGSDQVQLTDRDDIDIDPSWSPDGTTLVYSRRIDASWDLATIAATGGEPAVLSSRSATEVQPRWLSTVKAPNNEVAN